MTAAVMRGLTINLSAVSPIVFCLEDGTVLTIVEQQVVHDVAKGEDDKLKQVGPPTLIFALRPAPPPAVPEPSMNGDATHLPQPVPEKKAGTKMRGSGV